MKNVRFALVLVLLISSCPLFARSLNNEAKYLQLFDWVVKTFEENDAGFKYYVDEIGRDAYNYRVADYRKKVVSSLSEEECVHIINQWLCTFREQHIGLILRTDDYIPLTEEDKRKIRAEHQPIERVEWTEETFLKYLKNKGKERLPLEGIWLLNGDSIGIVRADTCYDVFTIRGDGLTSFPMQKKGIITEKEDGKFNYVKKPFQKFTGEWMEHSKSMFQITGSWKRWLCKLFPVEERTKEEEMLFRAVTAKKPFIERLTPHTLYLRIPSFMEKQKQAIDQLLATYDKELCNTANLIIDIRYGTGGSDASHSGLVPYYHTQAIRRPILRLRASKQNIFLTESYAALLSDSTYMLNVAQLMKKYIGDYTDGGASWVAFDDMPVLSNPQRIAIICNKENGSADEALLYMAKQSYKTKIFGQPTGGAFDFSNCMLHTSPDGKYSLVLTLSVTENRIEGYGIDGIGIQPDFYIDDSISEECWINYVLSVLEEGT